MKNLKQIILRYNWIQYFVIAIILMIITSHWLAKYSVDYLPITANNASNEVNRFYLELNYYPESLTDSVFQSTTVVPDGWEIGIVNDTTNVYYIKSKLNKTLEECRFRYLYINSNVPPTFQNIKTENRNIISKTNKSINVL